MHCIRCGSKDCHKSGFTSGKQRYRCKNCHYHFTTAKQRGVSLEKKLLALKLYKEGLGFRAIGRIVEVSNVAVLNWVRAAGALMKEQVLSHTPTDIEELEIIELDEMWHYTQKNSKNCGYGLLYLVPHDECLPLKSALVELKHLKDSGQR